MNPYNNETQSVIEWLESINSQTINELVDELYSTNDMEERMDICESILTELEFTLTDDELESEWFVNLHDDIKELTIDI